MVIVTESRRDFRARCSGRYAARLDRCLSADYGVQLSGVPVARSDHEIVRIAIAALATLANKAGMTASSLHPAAG